MVEHAWGAPDARPGGVGKVPVHMYGVSMVGGGPRQEVEGGAPVLAGVPRSSVDTPRQPNSNLEAVPPMPRDSLQNNQALPPNPTRAQHLADIIKASWNLIMATVLDAGKAIIMFGKNSLIWLPAICLALALLGRENPNSLMAPLCNLPVISQCSYCVQDSSLPYFSPDFSKLANLQTRLEGVMEESISNSIVAIDLKRSELAVRDLTTLVKHSSLAAKDLLGKNLDSFVSDAKSAGRDLQKFGSRVGGAIEQIIATNEYALLLLEQTAKDLKPQISGHPAQRILDALLPTKRVSPEALATRMKEIEDVWFEATGIMKSSVERLIYECRLNMGALDRLEEKLEVVNKIVVREDNKITENEEEMLERLWTKLGGNKAQLREFDSHSQLLKEVQKYRKDAVGHIARTLYQLEKALLDLEELDEQVSTPALTRGPGVPIEVHIAAMQKGTEQLVEGTKRARNREDTYLRRMIGNSSG